MSDLFLLRPLASEDVPFVYNSALKSFRDSTTVAGVPNTIYYAEHHKVIERIISDPHARSVVACNPEDPSQIFGYGLGRTRPEFAVIDWIYVKHPFRNSGIGKAIEDHLATATIVHYTHRVKNVERILKTRNYIYNPYLLNEAAK